MAFVAMESRALMQKGLNPSPACSTSVKVVPSSAMVRLGRTSPLLSAPFSGRCSVKSSSPALKIMAPVLKEVGAAMKDQISVVKVDTEKYPNIASRYKIQALPTFVLFVNGKPISFLEGAQTKDNLVNHVTQTLNAKKANVNY